MFSLPVRVIFALGLAFGSAAWTAAAAPAGFDVRAYGATGDGQTLDTAAFRAAVAACVMAGGGTVRVPPGRYLTGTIELRSHVTLDLAAGATILASEDPADYPDIPDVWKPGDTIIAPVLYAVDAENVTVTGRGTIDGQGRIWWKRLEMANPNPKRGWSAPGTPAEQAEVRKIARGRPHLISFVRCRDVLIEHVNLRNSPEWTVHPLLCDLVLIIGVSVYGDAGSHNTDGINPESCRDVEIANCRIDTGDDCVTLKSGRDEPGRRVGRPDENITITNCIMARGHGGVTIGSEMSGGVRNVTVANCVFQGTDAGIRIKSQRGRGGVVEGLSVTNVVMQDVPTPFVITTFYVGADRPDERHPVNEGTPRCRDFHFSAITARGAKTAGVVTGLREMPVENLTFTNIQIAAETGFTLTNARDIAFRDVRIDTARGPTLRTENCTAIDTTRLTTGTPRTGTPLVQDLQSFPVEP
jgi:polygalacturonase